MSDHYDPPTISQAFGDPGQTPPSTWSSNPSESYKPKPSAKTRGLIGRLGLRYHPTNSADLASHQAMLTLLCEDLATIPADVLEKAIQRHVATSPYMPKAADLTKLARDIVAGQSVSIPRGGESYAHDLAAARNAQMTRTDIEWIVDSNGQLRLQDKPSFAAWNTRRLGTQAERDRNDWKRAQRLASPQGE